MELNFCWWNIGISPPIKESGVGNLQAIELAKKYIENFNISKSLDVIALCEVSEKDSIDLSSLANALEMDYKNLSEKVGRVILDFSIMYEMTKLEFISHRHLVYTEVTNQQIRVGTRVVFKERERGKHLTLFLSHWPSKLRQNDSVRSKAAQRLRGFIDPILEKYGHDSQMICMGDYNTEPYTEPMVNQLYATRDYHIIKKKRSLLFNPTWFLLSDKKTNNLGTYLHKRDAIQRWHVIDQVIFSSSFLYGGKDCLKIDLDTLDSHRILDDDNICSDEQFNDNFDHYPIFFKVSHDNRI